MERIPDLRLVVGFTLFVFSKADLFRHRHRVLVAKMAIGFHRQRSSVLMSQPTASGGYVNSGLDAASGKQVPQVVMGDSRHAELLARRVNCLLAFPDAQNRCAHPIFFAVLGTQPLQQPSHVWDHWYAADFPVFRSGCWV